MKSSRDSTIVFFVLFGLILLLAGGGAWLAASYRKTPLDLRNADGNESRALVRAWLYEHSKSGSWEEVRWWEESILRQGKESRKFIKLRWRSQNSFGGPDVTDTIFEISKGKIVGTGDFPDVSEASLEKMFPEPL